MISIIIPVYNSEVTLRRCLDSVISQSISDWELILIDDGSTDKSGEICEEYASKDKRIKVFYKKNGGVSSARNVGLDNAKGEWIAFVDADDFVKEFYLAHLLGHSQKQVDLVISYAEIHNGNDIQRESYPAKLVDDTNFAVTEYSSLVGGLRQPLGIVLMNFAGVATVEASNRSYAVQGIRLPGLIMMNNFMFPLKTGTTTTRTSSDTSYSKEGNVWD